MRAPVIASTRAIIATVLLGLAAGCGGGEPPPATPAAATPSASATAAPGPAPEAVPAAWSKDMTQEQQVAFMKKNVVGRMAKVFQAHDATAFANFSCKTCHGPNFKDPKEFLPKLTFQDGKITSFAEKPEMSQFMAKNVLPEMAQAMGEPIMDPKTHQGFGCGGCHSIDMK
jgi:cytochrome c553